jgi:single-stranded-DNA-specific exonuclease
VNPPRSSPESRLPPSPTPLWSLAPAPEEPAIARLEDALSLPAPLCAVLVARGYADPDDAKHFLRPLLDDLHPPGTLKDAAPAVDRIARAVDSGETILVHGDFDVDGICGVVLLTQWLERIGGKAVPFVPHRTRDGYDFGEAGLRAARESGASLVVTVDCGTVAHEWIEAAKSEGIDVVVTDHHTPDERSSAAVALVNPSRPDCPYPNKALSGTGVAFKLCQLLVERWGHDEEELHGDLDLVALATVADLVPLVGENRTLVRFGLRALQHTERPGLRALSQKVGIEEGELEAGQVGYMLAPRINAAGRVGEASQALELLLTDRPDRARSLAEELERWNLERREVDERTLEEALEMLAADFDPDRDAGVVLVGEGWHPGVIGIVASKVVEHVHRPSVLIAMHGERGRGSARSISGFHLFDALASCAEHLERFGGHKQAAGLEIRRDEVDAFREAFLAEAGKRLEGSHLRPTLRGDLEIPLEAVSYDLFRYLRYMGPHGIGNPKPVFIARDLELIGAPRVVGSGHLKLLLGQGDAKLEAIGFGLVRRRPPESLEAGPVDAAFQISENVFRGVRTLQARLLDVRPSGEDR